MKRFVPKSLVNLLKRLQYQGGTVRTQQHKAGGMFMDKTDARTPYRYPAPGSQPRPHIPTTAFPERSYDIKYYPRDSRRNPWEEVQEAPEGTFFQIDTSAHLATQPQVEKPKRGSAGTGNPDVLRYNPDGLRSAMTATHKEMEKQLAKARPTQLMRYEWEARAEEVLASYQDHDIPPVPGRRPTEMDENPRRFQKRW